MSLLTKVMMKMFIQELPYDRDNIFVEQKKLLQQLLTQYKNSPLYEKLYLKQENVNNLTAVELKSYLSKFDIIQYGNHIYPLVQEGRGIVSETPDLHIKTSGTSDAKQ